MMTPSLRYLNRFDFTQKDYSVIFAIVVESKLNARSRLVVM